MTQASLGANRAVAVTATVLTPFAEHKITRIDDLLSRRYAAAAA